MRLASITLEGVLGAPDGTLRLGTGDAPARLVHLRGASGAGKTSVLRAIAAVKEQIGPYGAPPRPSALLRRGARAGRIAATWSLADDEREAVGIDLGSVTYELLLDDEAVQPLVDPKVRRLFATWASTPEGTRIELVPAARGLVDGAGLRAGPVDLAERLRGAGDKYAGLATWLVEVALADGERALRELDTAGVVAAWKRPDALRGFRQGVGRMLPDLRLRGVERRGEDHRVTFVRRDGVELDLFELSTSERDAVLLALAVHRYGLDGGIVVVDEPFTSLEPSRHVERLEALASIVPTAQVIVASSSSTLRGASVDVLELPLVAVARAS